METEEYDWRKFIDEAEKDDNGRIVITEEEEKAHMIKMRVVNKDHKSPEIDTEGWPKTKDGYVIITTGHRVRHTKIMNWVSENYPNCKYLPLSEQDKIGELSMIALKG